MRQLNLLIEEIITNTPTMHLSNMTLSIQFIFDTDSSCTVSLKLKHVVQLEKAIKKEIILVCALSQQIKDQYTLSKYTNKKNKDNKYLVAPSTALIM